MEVGPANSLVWLLRGPREGGAGRSRRPLRRRPVLQTAAHRVVLGFRPSSFWPGVVLRCPSPSGRIPTVFGHYRHLHLGSSRDAGAVTLSVPLFLLVREELATLPRSDWVLWRAWRQS